MTLDCLCTVANSHHRRELALMLTSYFLHHSTPAYVVCDELTAEFLGELFRDRPVHLLPLLGDRAPSVLQTGNANDPKFVAAFRIILGMKIEALREALRHHATALYADADVLFLASTTDLGLGDHDVLLSAHEADSFVERATGQFNAGYVAVRNRQFPDWWEKAQQESGYFDQQCLDLAHRHFSVGKVPTTHNVGWWRVWVKERGKEILQSLAARDGELYLGSEPLVSIQSHFLADCWVPEYAPYIEVFNRHLEQALVDSGNSEHRLLHQFLWTMRDSQKSERRPGLS